MSVKILVVDDSQTIQKVVRITLANMPYDIVECHSEGELFTLLDQEKFNLILFDYSLNDKKDGCQLASEILKKAPQSQLMAMLGTFDQVDDQKLLACGIKDKVIKPFESKKFIEKCENLINSKKKSALAQKTSDQKDSSLGQGWVMDNPAPSPKKEEVKSKEEENQAPAKNELVEEIKGWGMSIPGIIGDKKEVVSLFPPVIEGEKRQPKESTLGAAQSVELERAEQEPQLEIVHDNEMVEDDQLDEVHLPEDSDLEYPSLDDEGSSPEDLKEISLSSKLVSLDELASSEAVDEEDKETDPNYELPQEFRTSQKNNEQNNEEEMSPEDFWAVDGEPDEIMQLEETISLSDSTDHNQHATAMIDQDLLVDQIKKSLAPVIEEIVKNYCQKTVEDVAWEVIPDLAENLIKKEIKEISRSVKEGSADHR